MNRNQPHLPSESEIYIFIGIATSVINNNRNLQKAFGFPLTYLDQTQLQMQPSKGLESLKMIKIIYWQLIYLTWSGSHDHPSGPLILITKEPCRWKQ